MQYVEAMRGSSSSSRHHHRNKDAEREIKPATSLRSMHSIIHKHVAALAAQVSGTPQLIDAPSKPHHLGIALAKYLAFLATVYH